jgi:light-regulated signal transduction histidine kinase (bacteriophytochrome)
MAHQFTTNKRETVSLENCDKEPVHIPGHIQGFAILLATDPKLDIITHCSENAFDVFGEEVLGKSVKDVFDKHLRHDLNNTLSLSSAQYQRERVGEFEINSKNYDVWAHLSNGLPIIEIEPIQIEDPDQNQSILLVRSLLTRLQRIDKLQKTLEDAVISLKGLSGFDRVMLYQFDSNGDGEVKAEARSPDMKPFLGLRFPRWDIPNQAREIMKKLPLRMIADVNGQPVPITSLNHEAPPLDLTFAASRGQSPIHSEYLRNMGIGSTMTLTILVGGKLWGLFAFHNREPSHIGANLRGAAELFTQFFSLQMEQRLERMRNAARSKVLSYQSALLDVVDKAQNVSGLVENIAEPFCTILKADGLAIIGPDSVANHGLSPSPEVSRAIGQKLLKNTDVNLEACESLAEIGLNEGLCAGALALRLNEDNNDAVIFFRKEASQSVTWAGAPKKDVVESEDGIRLKPRGSFAAYKDSVKNKCLPWETETLLSANEIRLVLAKADAALFRRLSLKEERQRSIYIAELNHRVRNILALIRSLSRRAQESSNSLESYAKALEQRIAALGAAHDLAANQITSGVSINTIFETEAKPYLSETRKQLHVTGESFLMRADSAPIFALVIHELMTNCVKYGALSNTTGSIHINVHRADSAVKIIWKERGGPLVNHPTRRGFGLGLIENAIPYELEGDSKVDFHPDGLNVTLWLPESIVEPLPDALATHDFNIAYSDPRDETMPKSLLVLEDSMMIAMDMSDMLQKIGVDHVETYATVEKSLKAIEVKKPDFAILDISLRNETSFPVAKELLKLGVPFFFVTGYGSEIQMDEDLETVLKLKKPTDILTLKTTISQIFKALEK